MNENAFTYNKRGYTYVISDVHGCYDQFMELLMRIHFNDNDTLYLLGDIIDRGPKSNQMIRWLVRQQAKHNVIFMLGNHEQMMLQDCPTPDSFLPRFSGDWIYNGGISTSKQVENDIECSGEIISEFIELCRDAPAHKIVKFLDASRQEHEILLVHAGLYPPSQSQIEDMKSGKLSFDEFISSQSDFDKVWVREDWLFSKWKPEMNVIFGHTPTNLIASICETELANIKPSPIMQCMPSGKQVARGFESQIMQWNGRTAIDCGCVYGGRLACIRLEDGNVWYAQGIHQER